jgi:hypothetical protein
MLGSSQGWNKAGISLKIQEIIEKPGMLLKTKGLFSPRLEQSRNLVENKRDS